MILVGVVAAGISGCCPVADGAADQRAHRKLVAERTRSMKLTTEHTRRGTELVGRALVNALSGRTIVSHYGTFPNGRQGNHVSYRYFRPGGGYIYVDNWLRSSGKAKRGDYWRVNSKRLCMRCQDYSSKPTCYPVARTSDGTIQFYIDDPGRYYDLLSISARKNEFMQGPPPKVKSVFPEYYRR